MTSKADITIVDDTVTIVDGGTTVIVGEPATADEVGPRGTLEALRRARIPIEANAWLAPGQIMFLDAQHRPLHRDVARSQPLLVARVVCAKDVLYRLGMPIETTAEDVLPLLPSGER